VHIDNKKVNRNMNTKIEKASLSSSDSGSIFNKIKVLLKESKVIIEFEYVKMRGIIDKEINKLERKLILKCDKKAKENDSVYSNTLKQKDMNKE